MVQSNSVTKRLFTLICVWCPIFCGYSYKKIEFPILFFGILLLAIVWELLRDEKRLKILWQMTPVIFLLMCHTCYAIMIGGNIFGMLHNVIYIVILFFFMPTYFQTQFALRLYRMTVILSSIFGIIQLAVVTIFSYYIPGGLPIGTSSGYIYAQEMNGGLLEQGMTLRPRSFFSEPSDFGMYVGIYLIVLLLTSKKIEYKDMVVAMLISVAQACVRSSTGILLTAVAWIGYLIKKMVINKFSKLDFGIMSLLLCGGIGFLFTDTFKIFYERTFNFTGTGGTMGRIGAYSIAFDVSNYSIIQIFFGHNLLPIDYFLPGWGVVLWYFGAIGILAYALMMMFFYKSAITKEQKCICFVISGVAFFLTVFFFKLEPFYYGLYFAYSAASRSDIIDLNNDLLKAKK